MDDFKYTHEMLSDEILARRLILEGIEDLTQKVQRLTDTINGSGQEEGLRGRIVALERDNRILTTALKWIGGTVAALVGRVAIFWFEHGKPW